MSDEPPEEPRVVHIPTAMDKMASDFSVILRLWIQVRENAREIAKTRKALYDAYIAEGFSPAEALELSKSLAL